MSLELRVLRQRPRRGLRFRAAIAAAAVAAYALPAPAIGAPDSRQLRGVAFNIFTPQSIGTAGLVANHATRNGVPMRALFSALELDAPEALGAVALELAYIEAAGGDVVRLTFPWALLETAPRSPGTPPKFDPLPAARITAFLALTRLHGLKVVVNFASTPCARSSAPNKDCSRLGHWASYPPTQLEDMAAAVQEIIRRWGEDIYAIEVWNEPNSWFFLTDLDNCDPADPAAVHGPRALAIRAARYVPMVRAVYLAVKSSARPAILVAANGSAFSDTTFLRYLYQEGMKGHYDAMSIHPYHLWLRFEPTPKSCMERQRAQLVVSAQPPSVPYPDPEFSFTSGIEAVRSVMREHGDPKPLWLTEFGFPSCIAAPAGLRHAAGQSKKGVFDVSPSCRGATNQARWLAQSYKLASRWPFVRMAAMYTSRDEVVGASPFAWMSFGLLRNDFTAKPSYIALRDTWKCLASRTC